MSEYLYYADTPDIQTLPYTRDRAMSVSPLFYATRKEALVVVKRELEVKAQKIVKRMIEIEFEIAELSKG